jgi:hypothetical protein
MTVMIKPRQYALTLSPCSGYPVSLTSLFTCRGSRSLYTHINLQNICLNDSLTYLRFVHSLYTNETVDIKTMFVLHRRHITSPLQSSAGQCYVRFEVFTAVTMKNVVFWDVTPSGSCENRRFGESYQLRHQGDKNRRARNNVSSN